MKKDILISEVDFKELESAAIKWKNNEIEFKHTINFRLLISFDLYQSLGKDVYFRFEGFNSTVMPTEVKEAANKVFSDITETLLPEAEEIYRIKKENEQLNKIPKFIRYAFK